MPPLASRSAALMLALAVSSTGLAGCSEDPAEPGSGPSPAGQPTSASSEPTAASEPSVAPATGILLEQDSVTVNLPEGWKLTENQASFLVSGLPPASQDGLMTLSQLPSPDSVPQKQIERTIARDPSGRPAEVLDPLDVNGVEMVHVQRSDRFTVDSVFAAVYKSDLVNITVKVDKDVDDEDRDELVASVLASVVWR